MVGGLIFSRAVSLQCTTWRARIYAREVPDVATFEVQEGVVAPACGPGPRRAGRWAAAACVRRAHMLASAS
eukprot:11191892-Lingulodinium_polyedra.AAC.1